MKRVVITGYGIISALGNNVDTFWKNIAEGKSGIKLIFLLSMHMPQLLRPLNQEVSVIIPLIKTGLESI